MCSLRTPKEVRFGVINEIGFFDMASNIQNKLEKTTQRIKHVTSSSKKKTLFHSEEDNTNDLIFKIKEDLRVIPDHIVKLIEKGASLGVKEEIVRNVSGILRKSLMKRGSEFREVLELRSKVVQKELRRKRHVEVGSADRRKMTHK